MAATGAPEIESGSKQLLLIVLSVVFMAITAVGISFRLYARFCVLRKAFAEDILMLVGTIFAIGLSTDYVIGAYHGFGEHLDDIREDPGDLALLHNLAFAACFLYAAATLFVKFSFLMLYLRIDERRPMRWTVYALIFLILGQALATAVVVALAYIPPSQVWSSSGQLDRHCWRPEGMQIFWNVMNIATAVTSIGIYITPFFILRGLTLQKKQKGAIGALLALGFLPVIASCIKTYYAWELIESPDIYYKMFESVIWSQVEIHLAILCGSVQTYRILLRGFCPRCCRSPSACDSHDSEPDFFPPPTPARELESAQAHLTSPSRTYNSWANWEPSISPMSRTFLGEGPSRTPTPTESEGVAHLPPGMQPHYPNIATRIDSDSNTVWLFEAANDKRFSPPWPLLK